MINFIHRLFRPHCSECRDELENSRICQSCETLKQYINTLTIERDRLLEKLLGTPIQNEVVDLKPIVPKNIPWAVRRQMLETKDKEKVASSIKSISELEKELKI